MTVSTVLVLDIVCRCSMALSEMRVRWLFNKRVQCEHDTVRSSKCYLYRLLGPIQD